MAASHAYLTTVWESLVVMEDALADMRAMCGEEMQAAGWSRPEWQLISRQATKLARECTRLSAVIATLRAEGTNYNGEKYTFH